MFGPNIMFSELQDILPFTNPVLECGSILYSGTELSHLNNLDSFQVHVKNMRGFTFSFLTNHRNA